MTLIFHLGAHKTGTTAIQALMQARRKRLQAHGFDPVPLPVLRKRFARYFNFIERQPEWSDRIARPFLRHRLRTLIAERGQHEHILLSEENLAGQIGVRNRLSELYPRIGRMARLMVDAAEGRDVRFCMAIRSYEGFLVSGYVQCVARGMQDLPEPEPVAQAFLAGERGWCDVVADLVAVVGPERVTVWTYELFKARPMEVYALLAPGIALPPPAGRRHNLSLNRKAVEVMLSAPKSLTVKERKWLADSLRRLADNAPEDPVTLQDCHLTAALSERYLRDKQAIAALGCSFRDL